MVIDFIGECSINLLKALKYIFTGRINWKNTINQAAVIGYDSVPIALIITLVSGGVLALQVSKQFAQSGAESYIGGLVALTLVREMAPIFASLAIGARSGTAIAAELGNMQVTEQVDALKTLKVDPIEYLLVPRIIAGTLMVPLVTVLSQIVGILGGMLVANITVALHPNRYITSVWLAMKEYDINVSFLKAAIFGLLITLIGSTHGLLTKGGAKEVGLSTIKAATWSALAILIFDFFLTLIFY